MRKSGWIINIIYSFVVMMGVLDFSKMEGGGRL